MVSCTTYLLSLFSSYLGSRLGKYYSSEFYLLLFTLLIVCYNTWPCGVCRGGSCCNGVWLEIIFLLSPLLKFTSMIYTIYIYICSFNPCVCYTTTIVTMHYNCNWAIRSWGIFGEFGWMKCLLIVHSKTKWITQWLTRAFTLCCYTYTVHCCKLVLIASSTYLLHYQSYSVMHCVMSTMLV